MALVQDLDLSLWGDLLSESMRAPFLAYLRNVLELDPNQINHLQQFECPSGALTTPVLHVLHVAVERPDLDPFGSTFANDKCATTRFLPNLFPGFYDHTCVDLVPKRYPIRDSKGVRQYTAYKGTLYEQAHYTFLAYLLEHIQSEAARPCIVLKGAHVREWFTRNYGDTRTRVVNNKTWDVYTVNHPEWLLLRKVSAQQKALHRRVLETIASVHQIPINLSALGELPEAPNDQNQQQPASKRRKVNHTPAPKTADSPWEQHKALLTQLYIVQNLTVSEIMTIMSDEHDFSATKQQYQKKFRAWKLSKNVNEDDWLALSRGLKRYGLSQKDFDPQHGKIDVEFNGQVLAYPKVKKALYRYDTSLLKTDIWSSYADLSPEELLQMLLRNLTARTLIRDNNGTLRKNLPQELIVLLLRLSYFEDSSESLKEHLGWNLKRRSEDSKIAFPTEDEQAMFVSCISSIVDDDVRAKSFSHNGKSDLEHEFQELKKQADEVSAGSRSKRYLHCFALVDMMKSCAATKILSWALICCFLTAPHLVPMIMQASDISKLQDVSSTVTKSSSNALVDILLLTMARHGEASICKQLIAGGANPTTQGPCATQLDGESRYMTALQVCLETESSLDAKSRAEIVTLLLKAGADPNLCAIHGSARPDSAGCCEMSPFCLASKQSPTILKALLQAGARVPKNMDLTSTIQSIKDPDIISVLQGKGA